MQFTVFRILNSLHNELSSHLLRNDLTNVSVQEYFCLRTLSASGDSAVRFA
jgi:hypothetical protein